MHERNPRSMRVYKANSVTEASYDLTVAEHRLLMSCFAQIGKNATDKRLYRVYARDIAEMANISYPIAYRDTAKATDKLYERSIEVFDGPNGSSAPVKRKFRWIQEAIYSEGDGYVDVRLSTSILPYVNNLLEQYTVYNLQDISRMTSRYAIRIYELLVQWRKRGHRTVDIEWLKKILCIEGKYSKFKDLRVRVIEIAVSQINECSPISVSWNAVKTGRKVTHIEFNFSDSSLRIDNKKVMHKKLDNSKNHALFGIPASTIEKRAQPGESYEDAALRILQENKNS